MGDLLELAKWLTKSRIAANFSAAFFISLSGATLSGAGLEGIVYALLTALVVGGLSAANEWKKETENEGLPEECKTLNPKMSLASIILPFP